MANDGKLFLRENKVFVHYNVDNDNCNTAAQGIDISGTCDASNTGASIEDYTEKKVEHEDDLLQFNILFSEKPAGDNPDVNKPTVSSKIVLRRGSGEALRIWPSPTKDFDNTGPTNEREFTDRKGYSEHVWDLSDKNQRDEIFSILDGTKNLYVEGVKPERAVLSLYWETDKTRIRQDKTEEPVTEQWGQDDIQYTFVAAIGGIRWPTPAEIKRYRGWFPELVGGEWKISGESTVDPNSTPYYNCIAWTIATTTVWVNGTGATATYPTGVKVMSIDKEYGNGNGILEDSELDHFYASHSLPTPNTNTDGYKTAKVMYYSGYHGAARITLGSDIDDWYMCESKIGNSNRIIHTYNQLDNSTQGYGIRKRYYK